MRILIIGGDGMLGHQLLSVLAPQHDVKVTLRRGPGAYGDRFRASDVFFEVDVRQIDRVRRAVEAFRPAAIVNAAGIVKQRAQAKDAVEAIEVNALFPHRLAALGCLVGARVIHLSTDCVFSGQGGRYRESDIPDAGDLYGRSKLLGEITAEHCLTLRTSMIGLETGRRQGLVEWFLASRGRIKGYRRAIFSGFTTRELSRLIEGLLVRHPQLSGLWHAAAEPIDKLSLLQKLGAALGRTDVTIEPDDAVACDRSLCAAAFAAATGYTPPSWDDMLSGLADEIRARKE